MTGFDAASLPEGDPTTWPMTVLVALTGLDEDEVSCLVRGTEAARRAASRPEPHAWTPEGMLRYAEGHQGAANRYPEGDVEAGTLAWRVERLFPVSRLEALFEGGRPRAAEWFASECAEARSEDRFGYGDLLVEDIVDEVILVELPDGRVDVWDGWHRLAATMVKGATTIAAVVGRP